MGFIMDQLDFSQGTEKDFNDIFKIIDSVGWGETKEDIIRALKNPDNEYVLAT